MDPESAFAWHGMWMLHSEQGEFEEAIVAFDRALKNESGSAWIWSYKASALCHLGDLPGAIQACARAILADPTYLFAYTELARLLAETDQEEQALQVYVRALELAPNDEGLRAAHAALREKLAQK